LVLSQQLLSPGTPGAGKDNFGGELDRECYSDFDLFMMQHAPFVLAFYLFSLTVVLQIGALPLWYSENQGTALGSAAAPARAGGNWLY
jgi:hypothetical protein